MERRRLGKSGLEVPAVGMGTWETFDVMVPTEQDQRRELVEAAFRVGSIFFDSSPMYGQSEEVIGLTTEGRREKFQLATKVWCQGRATGEAQIANCLTLKAFLKLASARYGREQISPPSIHDLVRPREPT